MADQPQFELVHECHWNQHPNLKHFRFRIVNLGTREVAYEKDCWSDDRKFATDSLIFMMQSEKQNHNEWGDVERFDWQILEEEDGQLVVEVSTKNKPK